MEPYPFKLLAAEEETGLVPGGRQRLQDQLAGDTRIPAGSANDRVGRGRGWRRSRIGRH